MKTIKYTGTYTWFLDLEDTEEIEDPWTLFWETHGPWSIYPKDFDNITYQIVEGEE